MVDYKLVRLNHLLPLPQAIFSKLLVYIVLCVRLKHQHLIITEIVVSRSDDLFARLEPFEDFIILRILAADADFATYGLSSFRRDNIYPFAAGLLIECASRDEHCAFRLSEL